MKKLTTICFALCAFALAPCIQAQYPGAIEYHGVWTAQSGTGRHAQIIGGTMVLWTGRGICDSCSAPLQGYITMTNAGTGLSITNRFLGDAPTAKFDHQEGSVRQITIDSIYNIGGSLRKKSGNRLFRGTWYVNLAGVVER